MMARTDRDDLISLLQDWSYAAARMTRGLEVSATGAVGGSPEAPPDDTGEALGLRRERAHDHLRLRSDPVRERRRGPVRHRRAAPGRARAAARVPRRRPRSRRVGRRPVHPGVRRRPAGRRPRDPQPEPHRLRARAHPLVADGLRAHVAHDLGAADAAQPLRLQGRHERTSSPTTAPRSTSTSGSRHPTRPAWMAGGSYLVARKIAMLIETWDRVRLSEQNAIIGRDKGEGAPLVGRRRVHRAGLRRDGCRGRRAHARGRVTCASRIPTLNDGIRILRRGYNFVDGNNDLGRLDAGLFFLSYQRAPEQFVRLQRSLSTDVMNEYIRHVGSGVWAVPPGATPGVLRGRGPVRLRPVDARRQGGARQPFCRGSACGRAGSGARRGGAREPVGSERRPSRRARVGSANSQRGPRLDQRPEERPHRLGGERRARSAPTRRPRSAARSRSARDRAARPTRGTGRARTSAAGRRTSCTGRSASTSACRAAAGRRTPPTGRARSPSAPAARRRPTTRCRRSTSSSRRRTATRAGSSRAIRRRRTTPPSPATTRSAADGRRTPTTAGRAAVRDAPRRRGRAATSPSAKKGSSPSVRDSDSVESMFGQVARRRSRSPRSTAAASAAARGRAARGGRCRARAGTTASTTAG